jgi:hypothetical protein
VLYLTLGETSCLAKVDLPGAPLATAKGLIHRAGFSFYDQLAARARQQLRDLDSRRRQDFAEVSAIANSWGVTAQTVARGIRSKEVKDALGELDGCARGAPANAACKEVVPHFKGSDMPHVEASLIDLLLLDMGSHRCLP